MRTLISQRNACLPTGASLLGGEETLRLAIAAGHFVNLRFSILGRDFPILSLNLLQIYTLNYGIL